MNTTLKEILDSGQVSMPDGGSMEIFAAVTEAEGKFVQQLVEAARPKVSLEIGLGHGISGLFICEALQKVNGQRHLAIDPYQFDNADTFMRNEKPSSRGFQGVGLSNLKKAGFDSLIQFYNSHSYFALPQIVQEGHRVDFAFIDGWHTFDYVMVDFFYVDKLLNVGGIVAFHDGRDAAVQKVLRYILTNRDYSLFASYTYNPEFPEPVDDLGIPFTTCVALKKQSEDLLGDGSAGSRSWEFHRDF